MINSFNRLKGSYSQKLSGRPTFQLEMSLVKIFYFFQILRGFWIIYGEDTIPVTTCLGFKELNHRVILLNHLSHFS